MSNYLLYFLDISSLNERILTACLASISVKPVALFVIICRSKFNVLSLSKTTYSVIPNFFSFTAISWSLSLYLLLVVRLITFLSKPYSSSLFSLTILI